MIRDALMIELGDRAYRQWWYAMRNPLQQFIWCIPENWWDDERNVRSVTPA